ncbi:MAG TPA: hypothetical protein VM364_20515 [Vicinamibacterales bacterium]|nr:hypothetical protein [Vicinamibacterales bacterium]
MTPLRAAVLCVLVLCARPPAAAAQTDAPLGPARYKADLRFRTVSTGRFDIHFHQGEERLAARLQRIVEEVAPALERRYGTPRGRVHVVLVDQTDQSNGWATVIPHNLIELAAVPPAPTSLIGNTDDWLRLVFTHEYAHVLHLEKSRGLYGAVRRVFGRVPLAFPNVFLPGWQVEGLATFEESAVTGGGRVPAGDFRMLLERAAAADRFEPLDRAAGGVVDWPGGALPYLYGAYFHEYLARRFGEASLVRLADETAGRLPFTGSRAFKKVFGESLGSLWRQFEAETQQRLERDVDAERRVRLTHHGFTVRAPAFGPDGRLFYSIANPHGFPALMELGPGNVPRRLASRFHGNRLAPSADMLVFDQLEVSDQVALFSDLYVWSADGGTRRLTHGMRAADPDVAPDGRTIVCTVQHADRRILATVTLPHGGVAMPLLDEPDTEFSSPRWSPDGRSIVAERRSLGGPSAIVIIDVGTRSVRPVLATRAGRFASPTWLAGGAILFAWARDARGFMLHRVDLASGAVSRLAGAGPGAHVPAVSPNGSRVVYVGYSEEGYDLYSVPLADAEWEPAVVEPAPPGGPGAGAAVPAPADGDRPYSPLPTLAPRFWIPYVEDDGEDVVVGAATAGFDALGRHTYAVSAGWAMPRNDLDLQANYSYTRWRTALFVGASDDTDSWRQGVLRSREVSAGALLPFRRVRWGASLMTAVTRSRDDLLTRAGERVEPSRSRNAWRLGGGISNARSFGYSISPEEGAALNVVAELARGDAAGVSGRARTVVAELRGYVPVVPRHGVVAARLAGAASRGDRGVRRDFSAAGNGPQGGGFGVGVDAIGLLRGFEQQDLFGRSALVLNVDYRVPLAWPQRGFGTLPLLLRSVHAAVFLDAGHAWDEAFRRRELRRSAGAEMAFDVVLGGTLPVTLVSGAAWRHDPSATRRGVVAFARVGRAF